MNFKENIRIALFSIKSNKMRSFLTMLGIIIGVASVISIITIGNSGKQYIVDTINQLGGQSVNIYVSGDNTTSRDNFTDDDIAAVKKLSSVKSASPQVTAMGNISSGALTGMAVMMGGNEDYTDFLDVNMLFGRFYTQDEYDSARKVTLINKKAAEYYFGTDDAVGKSVSVKISDSVYTFKIIGVFEMNSNSMTDSLMSSMLNMVGVSSDDVLARLYIPATTINQINGDGSSYSNFNITANDPSQLDSAGNQVINLMYARHNNLDRGVYKSENMASYVSILDKVINVFTIFVSAVGAISLLVGGIGVMNIMLVSVTERTREIGIRKALGARTRTIMYQFLTESVIICLIGGLIGMGIGIGFAAIVASVMQVPLKVSVSTILIAVGFSTAVGIFFGIYPAGKAAKLQPIEALRRE